MGYFNIIESLKDIEVNEDMKSMTKKSATKKSAAKKSATKDKKK